MRGRREQRWRLAALVAASSLGLSACAIHGLSFVQDHRVSIVGPASLSTVTLPFTLHWTVKDFSYGPNTIQGGNNYFAVFIDRQPMPPGASLHVLGDDACKRTPGCPNETWLEQHDVFLTAGTSLTIDELPRLLPVSARAGTKEDHEIDIVLMSSNNRRIGESAWDIEFFRSISGFGGSG